MSAEVALVVSLPPEFADAVAQRVAQLVVGQLGSTESSISWLNVGSAAQYLDTTEDAIRGLVKRGQLFRIEVLRVDSCSAEMSSTCMRWVTQREPDLTWPERRSYSADNVKTGGHRANGPAPA